MPCEVIFQQDSFYFACAIVYVHICKDFFFSFAQLVLHVHVCLFLFLFIFLFQKNTDFRL